MLTFTPLCSSLCRNREESRGKLHFKCFIDEQANKLMTMLLILINGYELETSRINFEMYNPAYCFAGLQGRTLYGRIEKSGNRENVENSAD